MKLITIILSSIILLQSAHVSVADVMQLDEFIIHATFHKQNYGDSFLTFLAKHYGELKAEHSEKHKEEKGEHEQLPFQQDVLLTAFSYFTLNTPYQFINTSKVILDRESNFYYQFLYTSLDRGAIFQPPRRA